MDSPSSVIKRGKLGNDLSMLNGCFGGKIICKLGMFKFYFMFDCQRAMDAKVRRFDQKKRG